CYRPHGEVVAHFEGVPGHSGARLRRIAEAFQKDMIPIEDPGRERVVLGGPQETRRAKLLPDAVTVHIARDNHERVRRRILEDDARLVTALRPTDVGGRAQMQAVEAYGLIAHLNVCRSEEHTSELQSRGHLVCR